MLLEHFRYNIGKKKKKFNPDKEKVRGSDEVSADIAANSIFLSDFEL